MRYFIELAYNGTRFCGYQKQPQDHVSTIQETIEKGLTTMLREPINIVGCGRTDTGVHAAQYFIHFDTQHEFSTYRLRGLNRLIGNDIVCYNVIPVVPTAHARFDATSRSYRYVVNTVKSPFDQETAHYLQNAQRLDAKKMQAAAQLLLQYKDFSTFCKTNTDTKTKLCDLRKAEWEWMEERQQWVFHITADRFLRGMVRLIVGMCLNVGLGKYDISVVKQAMDTQTPLKKAYSAPAKGLFLTDIRYDYI